MNSSTPYEVVVAPDAFYSPGCKTPLPNALKVGLEDGLTNLATDPFKLGRIPPCPPYAPIGLYHVFRVPMDGIRYVFSVLFVADENRKQICVTHVSMHPPYEGPVGEA